MKKIFVKILSCVLGLCMLGTTLAGCDSCAEANWDNTDMTNWGSVVSYGGFLAETDNYIYYINGVANKSSDNTYGKPVKGALIVADKNDLSKTEIALPKLFAATDVGAGLYIFGDYVYYGTPSTDKASDGTVASSDMMFRRAKLDGSSDEHILTISSHSAAHRIVENNGTVYIVYYDTDSTSLVSYNTATKESITIAKTDVKTEGYESLTSYRFLHNDMLSSAVLVFATTVYSLPYNEDMNEGLDSTRPVESYNKIYTYSIGDGKVDEVYGKLVCDGSVKDETFAIMANDSKYIYIQKTTEFGKVTAHALTINELLNKEKSTDAGVEVVAEYATTSNLVVDLDNVYIMPAKSTDSSGTTTTSNKIYKDTMRVSKDGQKIDHTETKALAAVASDVHALMFVYKDYLYFYNTSIEICRVDLTKGAEASIERVSDSITPGASTWYAPEIVTLNGKDYLFYCDSSEIGLSYIKYVDLATKVTEVDSNNDGENDFFYIEGAKIIGQVVLDDQASIMQAKLDDIVNGLDEQGVLQFETDEDGKYVKNADGKIYVEALIEARTEYNALSSDVKEKVDATTLENYERAVEVANLFFKLDGIETISANTTSGAKFDALKAAYESVKADIKKYYADNEHATIGAYIPNNLKANYTKAVKMFEPKDNK
ncbi:MAG: hypothetical protein E7340_02630 [Clostridiales bacterium]|nr:hypothetical protein [Clostridiales bacterium]